MKLLTQKKFYLLAMICAIIAIMVRFLITLFDFSGPAILQEIELSELNSYYLQKAPGYFSLNPEIKKERIYLLPEQFFPVYTTDFLSPKRHNYEQSLLQFNFANFIATQNAHDLREAKINFTKKLKFIPLQFQFERPYHYFASWGTLFHPPLQMPSLPLEQVDSLWKKRPLFSSRKFSTPLFQNRLDQITRSELTSGNKLTLLANGDSLSPILNLINTSTQFLFIQMLVIDCNGPSAQSVIQAISQKAQESIDVRIMVDDLYSHLTPRCLDQLQASGAKVIRIQNSNGRFHPAQHSSLFLNDKSHLIIGSQAIFWGFFQSTGTNFLDRDLSLNLHGPATTDALGEFLFVWNRHYQEMPLRDYHALYEQRRRQEIEQGMRGSDNYNSWLATDSPQGLCRFAAQRPKGEKRDLEILWAEYVAASNDSIDLSNVKFLFSNDTSSNTFKYITLLKQKAANNVRIDLFANGIDGGNGELTIELNRLTEDILLKEKKGISSWIDNLLLAFYQKQKKNAALKHAKINFEQFKRILQGPNMAAWANFNFTHHKAWGFDKNAFAVTSQLFGEESFNQFYDAGVLCFDDSTQIEFEKMRSVDIANSIPYLEETLKD
ncbi:MAG: hypothetical protein A2504_08070 [Bdellovibrionales bacterium RIFOXYD12_FULL_39_22]|nr:MAG: hypothetical protein A2385_13695 [Bdellovibrionales bacterium RIFOXYB1_FULL_39_21]OFZ44887.1 MAG: hypothetical protein A2485_14905 [Bdellovibrionales bacterium RIFOXYC12_FULL_39_17]OFZ49405.1 MAG: hypothetical protein A2404_09240 [Bdellovibrionales bacterium RIFOXYC1_FULL_39_130]OFZ77126.1 MAG: hypothetical protein A2560_10890 [Bdellovibrionales bacterium RIFOXYD1_FULL_39_84]OFZ95587.1 MAG: hypothetical protein A2504_08070 [Bdellovibrionales bacterium RIFOXYD12_FULL_39_22]